MKKRICLVAIGIAVLQLGACGGGDKTTASNSNEGFTLSGTISVPANTAIDSDVNDPGAPYRSNDAFGDAQALPNPVIVGGYVNQANAGSDGRSKATGDTLDSYRVTLNAGQSIKLFIGSANFFTNDLDLILVDANQNVVDASTNRGDTEELRVPAAGTYVVQVFAFAGASNYVLSIGQGTTARAAGLHLSDDFAPGEVTVKLKSGILKTSALQSMGLNHQAGSAERRMLFKLDKDPALLRSQSVKIPPLNFNDDKLRRKYETLMAIKSLQSDPQVESAQPNYRFTASALPNDGLFRHQWHYLMMNLPQAWDVTTGDRDILVAVLDTGVLLNHPDLIGKTVAGYDFVADPSISVDGDGIDNDANDPGDQSSSGSSFHGTHVSGTVAALTNNREGLAGAGWNTRVMPLRVLGKDGAGYDYDIEQAMRYAAGMPNDSGRVPSVRASVINLSLGGPTISSGFQSLVNEMRQRGIFIVSAAGNEGSGSPNYPAALNGVVSVAAVDISRKRASYSNYHSTVDVTAPGGDDTPDINGDGLPDKIFSTLGDDSSGGRIQYIYAASMGTSMATPHVSAVIALMKAVNPSLTPQAFDSLLASGKITEDLGSRGHDQEYGHGLLDAYLAVLESANLNTGGGGGNTTPVAPAELTLTPGSLNFGLNTSSLSLAVANAGGGAVNITRITENSGGFLGLNRNTDVGANGLGTYTATLNRGTLAPGTYSAVYTFESDANKIEVPVIWQVGSQVVYGDAGHHYILLVDASTLETVKQINVNPVNGVYSFSFSGIPAGSYKLAAGSDSNNDFTICDAGEACGAYPVLNRAQTLQVNGNISGLRFTSGFNTNFLSSSALADKVVAAPYARPRLKSLER